MTEWGMFHEGGERKSGGGMHESVLVVERVCC